ncbi:MAG: hypothetical protein ABSD82_05130 [Solirubrobacteraceae bacterium]|jgi:hypothetical protein
MSKEHQRLRPAALTGVLAAILALALPAASSAALFTIGGLGKSAAISLPQPVDTAFWLTARKGGAAAAVSHTGLVRVIRLRGCARPGPAGQAPLTQIHFQELVPGAGGAVTVKSTSGPLNMPICGQGATAATVTTFVPGNLCAVTGGYVAFNVEGGYGPGFPHGVRYEVFGRAAGAVTDSYTNGGGTNNGATLTGTAHAGLRLLMEIVLGTGRQAGVCG